MLQAHAAGLGTCWIGAFEEEPLAQLLRVPDDLQIVGILTVGFPAEDPPPTPRKALTDLVHYDVYGNQEPGGPSEPGRVKTGALSIFLRRLRLPFRG